VANACQKSSRRARPLLLHAREPSSCGCNTGACQHRPAVHGLSSAAHCRVHATNHTLVHSPSLSSMAGCPATTATTTIYRRQLGWQAVKDQHTKRMHTTTALKALLVPTVASMARHCRSAMQSICIQLLDTAQNCDKHPQHAPRLQSNTNCILLRQTVAQDTQPS
jgi:hypothetical protein